MKESSGIFAVSLPEVTQISQGKLYAGFRGKSLSDSHITDNVIFRSAVFHDLLEGFLTERCDQLILEQAGILVLIAVHRHRD